MKTLSGVIADIILGSDRAKGTSTLVITFDKQLINGERKQILALEIFGEEASTLYPINIPSQTFEIELMEVINNSNDRKALVQGIYAVLALNLKDVLEPTASNQTPTEQPINDVNSNVSIFHYSNVFLVSIKFFNINKIDP